MNQYWMVDEVGDHAVVTGATTRDAYLREHWTQADKPTDGFVYIWHEGIEQPGRVTVEALGTMWSHRGWVAGPPPDGDHPFSPQPSAEPAETKPAKSAAAGDAKKE